MDRRNELTSYSVISEWVRSAEKAGSAISSPDGRWALVSTSLTAVIAGTIAWLAMGTMPPANSRGFDTSHKLFSYNVFQELTKSDSGVLFASLGVPDNFNIKNEPAAATPSVSEEAANANPGVETQTITLEAGDTLAGALQDAGISADDAKGAVAALAKVYDPRGMRAGQTFELTLAAVKHLSSGVVASGVADSAASPGEGEPADAPQAADEPFARLMSIRFSPTIEREIAISRAADGSFAANNIVKQLVAHEHRAGATIDSSLYMSAMNAGIPADVVVEMIRIFSYKVDFQRDIHPGDSFEVLYDYYYTPDGEPAKQGNISFALMRLSGREIALYRYQVDPDGPAEYFDAHGQSAKGMLMRTPVDGARLTSSFGMRFHPILGYSRMHKGVDFGVPPGTPVMAAGSGTIAFIGRQNGYGNFLLIRHSNGYSTAYGHLSRFARGMHKGSRVRQAQVVAYSGNTGLTTGPHLHYETRINNVQVNPTKVKFAQGRKLTDRSLRDFLVERLHIDAVLAATKLETKVADVTGDLRQATAK